MNLTRHSREFILAGSLLMFFAVGMGAFGAHAIRSSISPHYYDVYQTAVSYQFYHALGLLFIAIYVQLSSSVMLVWAARLLVTGTIIFSGSLYILSITATKWLGAITPIGGVFLLLGWLGVFIASIRQKAS